jgi:hypothetical protein
MVGGGGSNCQLGSTPLTPVKDVAKGSVRDGHGGGWSRKINAWHLYTLMVYL